MQNARWSRCSASHPTAIGLSSANAGLSQPSAPLLLAVVVVLILGASTLVIRRRQMEV